MPFFVVAAEENTVDSLQEGLITRLLTEDLYRDLKALDVQAVIFTVTELLERLKTYGEDCIKDKHLVSKHTFCPVVIAYIQS